MQNFTISANGTVQHKNQFVAYDAQGKLIATIAPRLMASGSYSERFLNVCFMDGKVEIADRTDGEFETEHAAEVIAKKLFTN